MDCDDLPEELHSHDDIKSFSYEDNVSDMQKQLEEERIEAAEEEAMRSVESFSENNGPKGNRSTDFGSPSGASYVSASSKGDRQTNFTKTTKTTTYVTNRNGTTTYTSNYTSSDGNPQSAFDMLRMAQKHAKRNERKIKFIVVIVMILILISFALPVIFAFMGMKYAESRESTYDEYYFTQDWKDDYVPDNEPVLIPPEVPEIPRFSRYDSGTHYYPDMAIVSQGETVVENGYKITVGTPSYIAIGHDFFTQDFEENAYLESLEDYFIVELPMTISNYTDENLNVSDFEVYLESLYIDDNGEIGESIISKALVNDIYLKGVVKQGITSHYPLYFAVPVAHYYSVVYKMDFNDNPEYFFYTDFTAEQVIKG